MKAHTNVGKIHTNYQYINQVNLSHVRVIFQEQIAVQVINKLNKQKTHNQWGKKQVMQRLEKNVKILISTLRNIRVLH